MMLARSSLSSSSRCRCKLRLNGMITGRRKFTTTVDSVSVGGGGGGNTTTGIISRRIWKQYQKDNPKLFPKKTFKKGKDPLDDKPWPNSVIYGAYIFGFTIIPYTMTWYCINNDTLRNKLINEYNINLDPLRKHFGELEHNSISYVDEFDDYIDTSKIKINKKKKDEDDNVKEIPNQYYHFLNELTYQIRKEQKEINTIENNNVLMKLTLIDDDQEINNLNQIHKEIGTIRATKTNLFQLLTNTNNTNTTNTNTNTTNNNAYVAIEFVDDENDNNNNNNEKETNDDEMTTTMTMFDDNFNNTNNNTINSTIPLLRKTNTFSSWYYHLTTSSSSTTTNDNDNDNGEQVVRMTNDEVEISRYEYIINEIETSLKDPNCTRDIDEMNNELSNAKSKLRKLKWKRRFGL